MASPVPVPRPRAAPRQSSKPPVPKPRGLSSVPVVPVPESSIEEDEKEEAADVCLPLPPPRAPCLNIKNFGRTSEEAPPPPPTLRGTDKPVGRPVTKSLLFDFDPLLSSQPESERSSSSTSYGDEINITYEEFALPNDGPFYDPVADDEDFEDESPPPPPPRQDSIPREMWDNIQAAHLDNSVPSYSESEMYLNAKGETNAENYETKRVSGINRAVKGLKKLMGDTKSFLPPLIPQEGLRRPTLERWLHEGRLFFYNREKLRATVTISTKKITWFVDGNKKTFQWFLDQCVLVRATIINGEPGIKVINCDGVSCSPLAFIAQNEAERDLWLTKIFSALTEETAMHNIASHLGWLYLKEGVGGAWRPCWLCLCNRHLISSQGNLDVDLRKARCFEKGTDEKEGFLPGQPVFVVQMDSMNLYLQGLSPKVTEHWRLAVKNTILRNGKNLNEQQLTPANVVVIVDMCTNFVTTNGIGSEGIYRKGGQSSKVTALLDSLSRDPYDVVLTRNEYTEHEVASALKRFFVQLPFPLLGSELMKKLACGKSWSAAGVTLRKELDAEAVATFRKVLGHLHLIAREANRNKMDACNLATVWSVGLTHSTAADITTIANLITHYPEVFDVDQAEMQMENKVIQMLEKLQAAASNKQTSFAGDLKIWITLGSASSTDNLQITLSPHKTAADIVEEAASHQSWRLQEVVLGGAMWRPIHSSEIVMEVVARWGFWSDEDRSRNKLVLGQCALHDELIPLAVPPATACGHFKLATPNAKSYKDRFVQLQQGNVCFSKMKGTTPTSLVEWPVKDLVWFNGYDPKRGPSGDRRWYLTLVPKNGTKAARTKETPFFGFTIAMERRQDLLEWCASLSLAEHPSGLGKVSS